MAKPIAFYPTRTTRKEVIKMIVLHVSLAVLCTAIPVTGFCLRLAEDVSRVRTEAEPLLTTATLIWMGVAIGVLLLALAYLIWMGIKLSFKLRDEVHIWTYYKETLSLITTFMKVRHPLEHITKMKILIRLQENSILTVEKVMIPLLCDVADVFGARVHEVTEVLELRDMKDATLVVTEKFQKKIPKSTEGYAELIGYLEERLVKKEAASDT
ncbi:MAG: hypothetical protein IJN11_10065 [Oscillospiraceae bacterium]|nr:hypothetical protein [Ruminococcus sp.]MBQ7014240.1 hypothetical protein [Oscillospiraceae bacterium]